MCVDVMVQAPEFDEWVAARGTALLRFVSFGVRGVCHVRFFADAFVGEKLDES